MVSAAAQKTSGICGQQHAMSFAWFDHAKSYWRTSQGSLWGISASSSPIWPRWGMWADGDAYELPSSAPAIIETEFGFLPTPTVAARKGSSLGALTRKNGRSRKNDRLDYAIEGDGKNGRLNPEWVEWFQGWPIGWTALPPLATDKFQEWLQQHGASSPMDEAA